MKISVVGIGRIGLVVATGLAKLDNEVTAIDMDSLRVNTTRNQISPFYETELDQELDQVKLNATADYQAIVGSDAVFLCVNTPPLDDGSISLKEVTRATEQVASVLKGAKDYYVFVVKSTVIPGTTEEIVIPLLQSSGKVVGRDFGVCVVPEFLSEGTAVHDFMYPARIVVGEYDARSGGIICDLFKNLNAPIVRVNLKTAEMIKYASNSFLAAKVSLINEIGNLCKILGIDVFEVANGMGLDKRIGSKFLNAGVGFGGPCFSKDLRALTSEARRRGYRPRMLEDILHTNEQQAPRIVKFLQKHVSLKGSCIGILGLSYKPGTDDVTDAPAVKIVSTLLKKKAKVRAYDPRAIPNFKRLFPQIEYVSTDQVLQCDAILIVTEWEEFEHLDYTGKIVIDGRRISKAMEARVYEGVCW
jgi:UDPglucose 6-dehydrogenase